MASPGGELWRFVSERLPSFSDGFDVSLELLEELLLTIIQDLTCGFGFSELVGLSLETFRVAVGEPLGAPSKLVCFA